MQKERLISRPFGVKIAQWVRYWTVSVMLLLCVVFPEVALTVTVKVPVGVPGLRVTGELPPPPQETRPAAKASTPSVSRSTRP